MSEPDWEAYPNFSRHEFACSCGCDRADMDPGLMRRLQLMRDERDAPIVITSGFRCPEYNDKVSSTGLDGPHTKGVAVDVSCAGRDAYAILKLAIKHGFHRIGVQQKGGHKGRFLHLDIEETDLAPWVWSY